MDANENMTDNERARFASNSIADHHRRQSTVHGNSLEVLR